MKKIIFVYCFGFAIILLSIYFFYKDNNHSKNAGIVSLTFDDGLKSQYSLAYPEMQKYGFNGTVYVLANWSGLFEGRELMTFQEAKELQNAGWEVGSHGLNHKSFINLSESELNNEIVLSKDILENAGLNITSLSFPFGYYNNKILNESAKYYTSSRPLLLGYNNLDKIDAFKLKSKFIKSEYSSNKICSWIKHSEYNGEWLILDFHSIENVEVKPWDESVADFREILQCINNSGIEVKTIKEVVEQYGKTI